MSTSVNIKSNKQPCAPSPYGEKNPNLPKSWGIKKGQILPQSQWITRGKKKDMVWTIYDNKSKGSDAQNYLSNFDTVLEIKKLCSYAIAHLELL